MDRNNVSLERIHKLLELYEKPIMETLNKLGNASNLIGYEYWIICTVLCIDDKNYFGNLMELYNAISVLDDVKYNTVISNMSRVKNKWLRNKETFEIFKKDMDKDGNVRNLKILKWIVEKVEK